ncbi:glycosyltransferase involved in cell wall biosynthesis [Duganella sp. 3397]|uniref:glycosyltransferase family 4 protein n=1 Tax=Duganella sp. 3397 TaxID=2817732 RepID=UPI00286697E1|nr:glycosyltransferase family 1 protein [Duganella sp. 3397]MDR7052277.1 glycosyltransferase involved in cell wall biosynthesis [Duganella sp. 3397]
MRILIDGFYLDKPRGMGRYLQELLFSLGSFAPLNFDIDVLIPSGIDRSLFVMPERLNYIKKRRLPFPLWEQITLPLSIAGRDYDCVHFPYNTMPAVMNLPLVRSWFNARRVVTIHDLMFMTSLGGNFYQGWGNRYRKYSVKLMSGYRTRVVTVSMDSGARIEAALGTPATVVYTPVERTCPADFAEMEAIEKWTQRQRFFLHIGGVSPHKNSARCIEAFLAAKLTGVNLVVLGLPASSGLALSYRNERSVVFPGWVTDSEVRSFLGHSEAVLFPSLMEGYGLPIVEAFAAGKPLLTSNVPPMSELAGDAAILVVPTSDEQLINGIKRLEADIEGNQDLVRRGKLRMLEITSAKMAEKLISVYAVHR